MIGDKKPPTKICSMCKSDLPIAEFYRCGYGNTRRPECSDCTKALRGPIEYPVSVLEKACRECRKVKLSAEFHRNRHDRTGLTAYCKPCARIRNNRWQASPQGKARIRINRRYRNFGLTEEAFRKLLASQNGRCAICKCNTPGSQSWGVDHDHKTGKVRGILCAGCNLALGGFKDDRSIILAAADYIGKCPHERFRKSVPDLQLSFSWD